MPETSNTFTKILLIVTTLLSGLFITRTFTDGDEGRYLMLAEAIATGQGQTDAYLPEPKPEALTPPLYPAVLAAQIKLFGRNLTLLKLSSTLFYLFYVAVMIAFFRRRKDISPEVGWAALAITLPAVFGLTYTWALFSEHLFLVLTALALFTGMQSSQNKHPYRWVALAGLFTVLAINTRLVGLAIIPALGLHLLFTKQWRLAFFYGFTTTLLYAPTILHTYQTMGVPFAHMEHYHADAGQSNVIATIGTILPHYLFHSIPRLLFFALMDGDNLMELLHLGALIPTLSISITLLILAGFIIRLRKPTGLEWFCLFYMPLISSYDVALQRGIEDRLLLPLMPIAALYLFTALRALIRRLFLKKSDGLYSNIVRLAIAYVILTSFGAGFIRVKHEWALLLHDPFSPSRHIWQSGEDRQAFGRYIEAAEWIKKNTPADTLIVSRKPRHTYLLNQRQGFRLAEVKNPGEDPWDTIARASKGRETYILQDAYPAYTSYGRDRAASIDPMLETHAKGVTLVHKTIAPVTRVWKINTPSTHE